MTIFYFGVNCSFNSAKPLLLLHSIHAAELLCHDKFCCCNNKRQPLTQDVFCSIMIKVSVLWEVVDLGAHATLHPYKQKHGNIRGKTS